MRDSMACTFTQCYGKGNNVKDSAQTEDCFYQRLRESLSLMASSIKLEKKLSLSVVFLADIPNIQEAYAVAEELARKNDAQFHGLYLYEFPARQPIICDSLYFTIPISFLQTLTDGLITRLNLSRRFVRFQVTDAPSEIAKPLPEGMIRQKYHHEPNTRGKHRLTEQNPFLSSS